MDRVIRTTEKRQAAQREVAIRRNVYAQRVQSGRMKQSVADFEIAVMDAIVEDYRSLEVGQTIEPIGHVRQFVELYLRTYAHTQTHPTPLQEAEVIGAAMALLEQKRPRWRHKKRGTSYVEIGRGGLQTSDPGGLQDDGVMVIYQGDDGQLHVRAEHEFMDGRFEPINEGKTK